MNDKRYYRMADLQIRSQEEEKENDDSEKSEEEKKMMRAISLRDMLQHLNHMFYGEILTQRLSI